MKLSGHEVLTIRGSSIVNEGIRRILNLFYFFFYEKVSHAQKAYKKYASEQKQKRRRRGRKSLV